MTFHYDHELATAFTGLGLVAPPADLEPLSEEWRVFRENSDRTLQLLEEMLPTSPRVSRVRYDTERDGAAIELRWYAPPHPGPGSAVVYLHGGGMIAGSLDGYDRWVAQYVDLSGVPFLAVGYRLAPELTGDGLERDAFAGLQWLVEHAGELGVDPARIAVMGDSAGGGIAAGAALLAREHGVGLARQLLVYPMLDDRTTVPDPELDGLATFTYADNRRAWSAKLGDTIGTDEVSPIAAPGRVTDHRGLAPAYLEVGELDIFRDETIAYAQGLLRAGVSAELHVIPGAPHGYDSVPGIGLARRAMERRVEVLRSL